MGYLVRLSSRCVHNLATDPPGLTNCLTRPIRMWSDENDRAAQSLSEITTLHWVPPVFILLLQSILPGVDAGSTFRLRFRSATAVRLVMPSTRLPLCATCAPALALWKEISHDSTQPWDGVQKRLEGGLGIAYGSNPLLGCEPDERRLVRPLTYPTIDGEIMPSQDLTA